MVSKRLIILAGAGVLLAALAAAMGQEGRERKLGPFARKFDADGDGRLSAKERGKLIEALRELRGPAQEPIPPTVVPGRTDLYKLADGPHALHVVAGYDLRDEKRDKTIPLRITIPKPRDANEGPVPLVVFCHGALGSKDGGAPLATYWASHGYVVIQPTFGDSLSLMSAEEKARYRSPAELVNSRRTLKHWDDRPRDVSFVLDSLDQLAAAIEPLRGRIDPNRIAVAGHSFGAHTSMLLMGMKLDSRGLAEVPDFRDERIAAAVMISPQGPGRSITARSYKAIKGPFLMITGDNDGTPIKGREEQTGPWRRQAFEQCDGGDRYLLWIEGAYHGFGGINGLKHNWPGKGPVARDHVYYVKSTALAFFDAYLRSDVKATAYLNSDQLASETEGKARLTAK